MAARRKGRQQRDKKACRDWGTRTYIYKHTHMHTHACTHTHVHTCMHMHIFSHFIRSKILKAKERLSSLKYRIP